MRLAQPSWFCYNPIGMYIHRNGGKTLQAGYHPYLAPYISKIDNGNLAYGLDSTQASLWHAQNHTVLNYANPQTGVEDPEIFRENYGYALWVSGYDGAMTFAYQRGFNHTWNDFDDPMRRDEVFAYPKSDGVIDTIEWEGYREGVDDTRYADTLSSITGNRTEATTIINAGISAGSDMSVIRARLIDRIIYYIGAGKQTVSFTCTPISGSSPLSVRFTDSSSVTPTSRTWNFGDVTWYNTTIASQKNPTHIYSNSGTYTAKLTACDASGCNTTIPGTTITVMTPTHTPSITVTSPDGGESWQQGTTQTIRWSYTGSPGSTVKIESMKGGQFYQLLNSGTTTGSAGSAHIHGRSGRLPILALISKIRVTRYRQLSLHSDTSNADFTISAAGALPGTCHNRQPFQCNCRDNHRR